LYEIVLISQKGYVIQNKSYNACADIMEKYGPVQFITYIVTKSRVGFQSKSSDSGEMWGDFYSIGVFCLFHSDFLRLSE